MKKPLSLFIVFVSTLALVSCNTEIDCSEYTDDLPEDDSLALAYNWQGLMSHFMGNNDSALYYFDKGLEADQSAYFIYSSKSRVYLDQGKDDLAIEMSEKAVDVRPDLASTHIGLGMLYDHLDNFDAAMDSYEKGMDLTEETIECTKDEEKRKSSKFGKAVLYRMMGDEDACNDELDKLLEDYPEDKMFPQVIENFKKTTKKEMLDEIFRH